MPPGSGSATGSPAAMMFAADQASKGLGMELIEAGEGRAVLRMRVARTMINGHSTGTRSHTGDTSSRWPTPPSRARATAAGP
jgi:hypothetical protein